MPLIKSKSKEAFVSNLKAELAANKPRAQALAIAYSVKRRARAAGGGVHVGSIASNVPGRTDAHPLDVGAGSYVVPAETVSHLGENNTAAGLAKLDQMTSGSPEQILAAFGVDPTMRAKGGKVDDSLGKPTPINAAGGEYVIPQDVVSIIGGGDVKRGHINLDAWVMRQRKKHVHTLQRLPPPARD